MQTNIAGISPGTKEMAIAIYRDGNLVDWRRKSVRGKWSEAKHKQIKRIFENTLKHNGITHLAFKLPRPHESSRALFKVIDTLTALAEKYRIPCFGFGIDQLKRCYKTSEVNNKKDMMEVIVQVHPEIRYEYEMEKKNREGYYLKVFEAVACAHLLINKLSDQES